MTVGEIRDELIKMLGNSLAVSGHPFISPVDMTYRWIYRAANKIPRLAAAGGRDILSTFEELYDTWRATTTQGSPSVARPAAALIVREVYSFDKTPANSNTDTPRLLTYQESDIFDQGISPNESPGFPYLWTIKANFIYFRPLPVAPYLTDVRLRGIKRESAVFSNPSQTLLLREDWHEAVLLAAAGIGARALGYFDRAKIYDQELATLIGTGVDVPVSESIYDDPTFDLGGLLDQSEVYD